MGLREGQAGAHTLPLAHLEVIQTQWTLSARSVVVSETVSDVLEKDIRKSYTIVTREREMRESV